MPFIRGDIVLVLFPNSDFTSFKPRPALVIQADNLITGVPQTVIALVTTNLARAGHPSRVTIKMESTEGKASGLLDDSVIMTDNIATVRNEAFRLKLGSIPDMESVPHSQPLSA